MNLIFNLLLLYLCPALEAFLLASVSVAAAPYNIDKTLSRKSIVVFIRIIKYYTNEVTVAKTYLASNDSNDRIRKMV